jgi:uncharacterized protein YdaU (DUF1376 family)
MKPPAFQFYPDDFIGGTCDLSAEEVGVYIRLLCYQWSRGAIPEDAAKLARIAGINVTSDTLQKFPNGQNARLEFERKKQSEYREEKAKAGKAGAKKRWHNHSTPIVLPMANTMANDSSPSPSPSPLPIKSSTNSKAKKISDEEWMAQLKTNSDYSGINIAAEFQRAHQWCQKNSRQNSRHFFQNWLGKCEKPLTIKPKSQPQSCL